jgi:S1-C subfamily serine protease
VDRNLGLALLRVGGQSLPTLQPTSPSVKPSDSVLAIGTRGKLAVEPAIGAVTAITPRFVEVRFQTDIQGFGGGPVFSNTGAFIGIVHSRRGDDETVDQCVRGDVVLDYLQNQKLVSGFVGRKE